LVLGIYSLPEFGDDISILLELLGLALLVFAVVVAAFGTWGYKVPMLPVFDYVRYDFIPDLIAFAVYLDKLLI
jgi:hypothetical protein